MTEQNDDLDDLIRDFVNESREHIGAVETQLLKLEEGAGDADTINEVFRCVHSIKGVAGFLGLDTIQNLAHVTESTLDLVRKERLEPSAELISALLESIDVLKELVESPEDSNGADIEQPVRRHAKLRQLALGRDLGLGEVAAPGLVDVLYPGGAGAELNGVVAVLILGAHGHHLTAVHLEHCHRNVAPLLGEHAGHAHLLRK